MTKKSSTFEGKIECTPRGENPGYAYT